MTACEHDNSAVGQQANGAIVAYMPESYKNGLEPASSAIVVDGPCPG